MPRRAVTEVVVPMWTVRITAKCPACEEAEMAWKNISQTSHPPQYPHRCVACGHEETYSVVYPLIEHREAG